jgi:hypothetical protein
LPTGDEAIDIVVFVVTQGPVSLPHKRAFLCTHHVANSLSSLARLTKYVLQHLRRNVSRLAGRTQSFACSQLLLLLLLLLLPLLWLPMTAAPVHRTCTAAAAGITDGIGD